MLEKKSKGKLIVLRPRDQRMISQEDLEELMLLGRQMKEAESKWKDKRDSVRRALVSGATVEPGIHIACIAERTRLVIH